MADDEIQAQIASIEAQLAAAQNAQQADTFAQWQPQSTFQQAGYGILQPQGFPQQNAQQGAPGVVKHQFSDDRSVFVMNIPRVAGQPPVTPEELGAFFTDCGPILTCTVLKDRATGELKGSAYLEFATHEACGRAIDTKNNALFRGVPLYVCSGEFQKNTFFSPLSQDFPPRPLSLERVAEFGGGWGPSAYNSTSHTMTNRSTEGENLPKRTSKNINENISYLLVR
jgi:RNA recognition motif-containing protein